jgi:UDP-glucose 4-epimerase
MINILEMMKKKQISSLVVSSTDAVYKENETGFYDEDSTLSSQSIYGSSKVICEELISQYERLGHINQAIIFRYFNLAGDTGLRFFDLHAQNVFPMIARAYLENRVFSIFGDNFDTPDGTEIRDYIHLSDLVEAHVLSLRGNIKGFFNLGTQQGTSVKKLTEIFNSYLERPLKLKFADRSAGDVAKAIANSKKAEIKFGWVANASLEDMVRSTIETFNVR